MPRWCTTLRRGARRRGRIASGDRRAARRPLAAPAAARQAWVDARPRTCATEAFLFYAGPIDGPGGPLASAQRLAGRPGLHRRLVADPRAARASAASRGSTRPARLSKSPPAGTRSSSCSGARTGPAATDVAAGEGQRRRREYLAARRAAARQRSRRRWSPPGRRGPTTTAPPRGDGPAERARPRLQRHDGACRLRVRAAPYRRRALPGEREFQQSPFSDNSAADNRAAFDGAREVYFGRASMPGRQRDPASPRGRRRLRPRRTASPPSTALRPFLAPPAGSPDRAAAEAAVRALTDLAATSAGGKPPRRAGRRPGA